ncbi:uncharacterized protein [Coffea arabica]|uniref:2'-phosphotransferase n=1 Tax=Coffea arabica TaxID=13443 RepID=A0ABM4WW90_COFAR
MWATLTCNSIRFLRYRLASLPPVSTSASSSRLLTRFNFVVFMEPHHNSFSQSSSSSTTFSHSSRSGGRGRGLDSMKDNATRERHRGRGGGSGGGKDKIDALGRLLTRVLRHMASELNLNMRNDGFVKVDDLLKLSLKTFANVPLRSHTVDEVREAVRRDNKQRFSLVEENGELWIRANQGHTITTVETESLLKPILSADEVPGMRRDVNILIFLDVRKALEEGMKLYISDNKVILTEGFEGVVPAKYFQKIESWPDRKPISF